MTVIESDTTRRDAAADALRALLRRDGVQQFIKFCLVGATSTVIDFSVLALLDKVVRLPARFLQLFAAHPAWHAFAEHHHMGFLVAAAISFTLAVSNGFYFNRRWTFADVPTENPRRQYVQFVLVNIVGLLLTLGIIAAGVLVLAPVAGRSAAPYVAKVFATGVVVFWNFLANKYWTFKT